MVHARVRDTPPAAAPLIPSTLAPISPIDCQAKRCCNCVVKFPCISLIKQKGFDLSPSTVNDFNQLRLIRLTKTHRKTVNTLREKVNE